MSRGIGGSCRKIFEDENTVVYACAVYNCNQPGWKKCAGIFDGRIELHKRLCLVGSLTERPFSQAVYSTNASNCWQTAPEGQM